MLFKLNVQKKFPNGKILETNVVIAKNYLNKEELENLELIVLEFLDLDILKDAGKICHEIACDKALTEFEKYRIKQDKLYKSDFDLLLEESKN